MRFHLAAEKMPTAWFNMLPRLPEPLQPPLHPGTREPVGPDDLAPLFPMALIEQEMSPGPWIDIPGEVLDVLRLWRPTPLVRRSGWRRRSVRRRGSTSRTSRSARRARTSPTPRCRRPSTTRPRARRLTTETGAGQWGTALAFACAQYDLECKVYMVRTSFESKPYRRVLMETWGADCVPSPVDDPSSPGSLGLAISDAVRDAATPGRLPLRPGLGAEPRAAAPDHDRTGGQGAAGHGRASGAPTW